MGFFRKYMYNIMCKKLSPGRHCVDRTRSCSISTSSLKECKRIQLVSASCRLLHMFTLDSRVRCCCCRCWQTPRPSSSSDSVFVSTAHPPSTPTAPSLLDALGGWVTDPQDQLLRDSQNRRLDGIVTTYLSSLSLYVAAILRKVKETKMVVWRNTLNIEMKWTLGGRVGWGGHTVLLPTNQTW